MQTPCFLGIVSAFTGYLSVRSIRVFNNFTAFMNIIVINVSLLLININRLCDSNIVHDVYTVAIGCSMWSSVCCTIIIFLGRITGPTADICV